MPWREETPMSSRRKFVVAFGLSGESVSALCREFGISRKTGYKWLRRYEEYGESGLAEESRRPHGSPGRTAPDVEERVLEVREQHPAWGGRKIRAVLVRSGFESVPAPSTITDILRRHGCIDPVESSKHRAFNRFERASPNELWQMDFKGHYPVGNGRCHPLTILDDHSRYLLRLEACPNESRSVVESGLRSVFDAYGLPEAMLMDNGAPWGHDSDHPYTKLTVWLITHGIRVIHGRPYHPQTQGKEERLHRTLASELLSRTSGDSLDHWQRHFDGWRRMYNHERPHEALGMHVPAERYRPSDRVFADEPLPHEYPEGDAVRKVDEQGGISFRNTKIKVGKGFHGRRVGLRPTPTDGVYGIYFYHHCVKQVDCRDHQTP